MSPAKRILIILLYFSQFFIAIVVLLVESQPILTSLETPHIITYKLGESDLFLYAGNAGDLFHNQIIIQNDYMLIGSRNVILNLSLSNLKENKKLVWNSTEDDKRSCLSNLKSDIECQNVIKLLVVKPDSYLQEDPNRLTADGSTEPTFNEQNKANIDQSFMVCGTNSYRPLCRTYTYDKKNKEYLVSSEDSGIARCPYDPSHNSTAIYHGDTLFSASAADRSSRTVLIFTKTLKSEQHDSQWLNEPNFISSFLHNDKVYFLFRETAVENINCGKAAFSRIARVCANDKGGKRLMKNTWTSFFKVRLNCSLPGEFPFYFDEIQSSTELGMGNINRSILSTDQHLMFYGVFNTPRNGLQGSAICAFRMVDVLSSFEGPFKEQKTPFSNWLAVKESETPTPHPAKMCANDSFSLSDQTLNFIKSHVLMDKAVPSFGGRPLLVLSSFDYTLTQIAVDWRVPAADGAFYDVLFIGTDDGRILKVVGGQGNVSGTKVIEVLTVFSNGAAVTSVKIYVTPGKEKRLLVTSQQAVASLALHRCYLQKDCRSCIALRDPYCSWSIHNNTCLHHISGYQSVGTGRHIRCGLDNINNAKISNSNEACNCSILPITEIKDAPTEAKQDSNEYLCQDGGTYLSSIDLCPSISSISSSISSTTLLLAIIFSILPSLILGFFVGLAYARRSKIRLYALRTTSRKRKKGGSSSVIRGQLGTGLEEKNAKSENFYDQHEVSKSLFRDPPDGATNSLRPIHKEMHQIDQIAPSTIDRVPLPPRRTSSIKRGTNSFRSDVPHPNQPPPPPPASLSPNETFVNDVGRKGALFETSFSANTSRYL